MHLGPDGYTIGKKEITAAVLTEVKKDLTVCPFINPAQMGQPVLPFPLYRETEQSIIVPRYYGVGKFGPLVYTTEEIKTNGSDGSNGSDSTRTVDRSTRLTTDKIMLKEHQIPIVEKTVKELKTGSGSGLLNLYTGAGKTVIALHIISLLKVKTMIIVHKSILLKQWADRIAEFIPGARIGYLQGKRADLDDKYDIVIAMLQSLSIKSYDDKTSKLLKTFGLLIVDECHHIGAEVFCRSLSKVAPNYNLGLSATLDRKDGLTKVFKWYLGDVIWKSNRLNNLATVKKIVYRVGSSNLDKAEAKKYLAEPTNYMGKPMLPLMLNNVASCYTRNKLILHEVSNLAAEGRRIMVMSERIAQLKHLHEEFSKIIMIVNRTNNDREKLTCGLYIGKMKQHELDESAKKTVIFASAAICREGLDIPELNTLVLATPSGDVVQACGRIMRKQKKETTEDEDEEDDELHPVIVDIVDSFSVFINQGRSRTKYYEKSQYKVVTVYYRDDAVSYDAVDVDLALTLDSDDDEDDGPKVDKVDVKMLKPMFRPDD